MPIGQLVVQIFLLIQSPVFLTLYIANVLGIFKKAPHGQINRQKPFLPRKYTIKKPSIKNVSAPIKKPGKKAHILGYANLT